MDLIDRQAVIDTVKKHYRVDNDLLEVIVFELENLPSAQPERLTDYSFEESCADCPAYDTENHRCPRFNQVIRMALKDANLEACEDCISRQDAITEFSCCELTPDGGIDANYAIDFLKQMPSAQPGCEDMVPRKSVEYICRKNTVSTNPYEHKYHDKFIQFMNDPEISDFGRWQHSNGFNTALVAVKCDLDKVPSVTPKTWEGGQDERM